MQLYYYTSIDEVLQNDVFDGYWDMCKNVPEHRKDFPWGEAIVNVSSGGYEHFSRGVNSV